MEFTAKLNQILDRKGWTVATLADAMSPHAGRSTVYNWASGKRSPKIKEAHALSVVLEIPLEWLADDEIDLPPLRVERAARYVYETIRDIGVVEAKRRLQGKSGDPTVSGDWDQLEEPEPKGGASLPPKRRANGERLNSE